MEHQTLEYYDRNAQKFFDDTVNADMSEVYERFEAYLRPGAHILDLGCGSGRDSKYFLSKGYSVTAVDGSEQLCCFASELIGQEVVQLQFQDLDFDEEFDAVWACASLVHVEKKRMKEVVRRVFRSMKPGGVLYISFKYGNGQRVKDNRLFSDYVEADLDDLFSGVDGAVIKERWITSDVRAGRGDERWLNAVVHKGEKE